MAEKENILNFDISDSSSIFSKNSDSSNENRATQTKPCLSFICNVYQCKYCNGNRPKLTQKQLDIIKQNSAIITTKSNTPKSNSANKFIINTQLKQRTI